MPNECMIFEPRISMWFNAREIAHVVFTHTSVSRYSVENRELLVSH